MMNESRTIVITGASAGIGHCIATRQLQQGMSVLGIGRDFSNPPSGKKFMPVSMDLGDLAALPEALKDLTRRYPGVRGVICCAGAGQFGSLEEFSFNKIRRMIDL
ncbi:MAG: short-chain dehydrogenase, partial [Deltaproteobacteria bacterium]|nr:short-chain dehydrogenase [Deltaproteobacteria bacterium]